MKTAGIVLIIAVIIGLMPVKAHGQYCTSTYSTVCISPGVNDFIDNFWTTGAIANITNMNSSCNMQPFNYIYYSNMAVTVSPGSSFQVHMQCSHTYQQGFVIWIDWNSDQVFQPTEMVYNSVVAGFQVFSGTVTVPLNVACGVFRMRVRCNYSTVNLNPCNNQTYGETEDYNVIVNSIPPVVTTSSTPASCGVNDGTATISPTSLFSYNWLTNPPQTTATATGLGLGTYSCVVVPGPGCPPDTFTVTVPLNPSFPSLSVSNQDICAGDSVILTAIQSINHTGGDFLWQPGNYTTQSIKVSPSATQTYTVTYSFSGCTSPPATGTVTVHAQPLVFANASTGEICNGDTSLFVASGADNFQWMPTLGLSSGSGNMVLAYPTVTTNYMVVGTNQSFGCSDTSYLQLIVRDNPVMTLSPDIGICEFQYTTLSAGGATSYQWNPTDYLFFQDDSTAKASPLITTTYVVTGMNDYGCVDSIDVKVTVHGLPVFTIQPSVNSTCVGDTATLMGSDPSLSYNWVPLGVSGATIKVFPTTTTSYIAEASNIYGCKSNETVTITVNPLPVVSLSVANSPICTGNSTSITASGADSYNWLTTPDMVQLSNSVVGVSPIVSTQYSVTGVNQTGCSSTESIQVDVFPPLSISASPDKSLCIGQSYNISATASGGNGNYHYSWYPPDGLNHANLPGVTATPDTTTTYTLTLTDNCTVILPTAQVKVYVNNLPDVTFASSHIEGCVPLEVSLENSTPNTKHCIWDLGDNNTSTANQLEYNYQDTGKYYISLSVTDQNDCVNSSTYHTLTVNPLPKAAIDFDPEKTTIFDPRVSFNAYNSSKDVVRWHWDFAGFDTSTFKQAVFSFPDTGYFPVGLKVQNRFGCEDSVVAYVTILEDLKVFIPNSFTPNDDGLNDLFGPVGAGISDKGFYLAIFNRWGEKIYETNQLNQPWDGRNMNNGKNAGTGVYTYLIHVSDLTGSDSSYNGMVNLIR